MADRDGAIRWYTADPRGVLPLDAFHVPGTLAPARRARASSRSAINHDFEATMRACMAATRDDGTWINDELIRAYVRLHNLGFAHSVEAGGTASWPAGCTA